VPDLIVFPQVISSLGKRTLDVFSQVIRSFFTLSYVQHGLPKVWSALCCRWAEERIDFPRFHTWKEAAEGQQSSIL